MSELKLSNLIYGTWRLCDSPATPQQVLDRIQLCIKLGITSFDLADIYGGGAHQCEVLFGQALAVLSADERDKLRAKIQLIGKCNIRFPSDGHPGVYVKHYDSSRQYIERRVDETLQAVGVKSLDLLLLHRADCLLDAQEVADTMKALRRAGKVTHFGVSNFSPSQMALLQSRLDFPLYTNQIELSVMHMQPMHDGTLDYLYQHNMVPMIWSPLAGARIFKESPDTKELRQAMLTVASQLGKDVTIDQVALAWLLRHPAGCKPILGTNNPKRIEAAAVAMTLHLDRQQWYSIWQASAGKKVP